MTETGPFAAAALDMAARGLAVLPVGGPDGKVPLVAWANWRRPPGKNFLQNLACKHGAANVAILTGLSSLTVVDIDQPDMADAMQKRFGQTPLVIETPSGGRHLYYRAAGEGCGTLREAENLPVDIKAAGGVIVAPPSVRPSGPHSGKCYRIVKGSWDDLPRLPTIKSGSLPASRPKPVPGAAGAVTEGARSNTLLKFLLREAKGCDSPEALIDVARGVNDSFVPPLPDAEILHVAQSAWKYESRNENWAGTEARTVLSASEAALLRANPEAGFFLLLIRLNRGGRDEPFAVSPEGLRRVNFMPGWGERKYGAVRNWLAEAGFLSVVHQGGAGAGDPRLFKLANPAQKKPSILKGNITKTSPLFCIPARRFAERRKNRLDDGQVDLVTLAGGEPAPRQAPPEIFGPQIKSARQARGMTQASLAALAGITRAALANVERAAYPAGPGLQRRLSEILQERTA